MTVYILVDITSTKNPNIQVHRIHTMDNEILLIKAYSLDSYLYNKNKYLINTWGILDSYMLENNIIYSKETDYNILYQTIDENEFNDYLLNYNMLKGL